MGRVLNKRKSFYTCFTTYHAQDASLTQSNPFAYYYHSFVISIYVY